MSKFSNKNQFKTKSTKKSTLVDKFSEIAPVDSFTKKPTNGISTTKKTETTPVQKETPTIKYRKITPSDSLTTTNIQVPKSQPSWNVSSLPVKSLHGPTLFIEVLSSNKIKVNPLAIQELNKLSKPLKVIGICGPYRSGKSFLLNYLFGSTVENCFEIGHSTKSVTKGIWMKISEEKTYNLIVLDTEGLNDVTNDKFMDQKLISLIYSLSSFLIMNVQSCISMLDVKNFKILQNLKANGEAPVLLYLLRDFNLTLTCPLKTYILSNFQKEIKSKNIQLEGFTLPTPCDDIEINLSKLSDNPNVLRSEFKESCSILKEFIFQNLPVKYISKGENRVQCDGISYVKYLNSLEKISFSITIIRIERNHS
jgi:GTPase SAR1 family protein